MLLTRPLHSAEFLKRRDLGVEVHITRDDVKPDFARYIPFVHGIHLPYDGINLAALDEKIRLESIAKIHSAVNAAVKYSVERMTLHPCGILSFLGEKTGEYGLLIDSLRDIADFMAEKGLICCLENQLLRQPEKRVVAACSSEDWLQLLHDIKRPNILLTFDSSHAACYAVHKHTLDERVRELWKFLEHPDLIGHFHWSDSMLAGDSAAYNDLHLVPGKGDLPLDIHRAIKRHPAVKLLEQRCTEEAVEQGLEFIASL